MKKLTSIILTCAMILCAAASCGDKKDDSKTSEKKSEVTTAADTTAEAETTTEADTTTEAKKDDDKSDSKDSNDKKDSGVTDAEVKADKVKEIEDELKKFAELSFAGDTMGIMKLMYPDSIIEALNNSGYADMFVDADEIAEQNIKLTECKANDIKELNADALLGAEKYFNSMASMFSVENFTAEVEEGYACDMYIEVEQDGEKEDSTDETCIVRLKDGSWKVVPKAPDALLDMNEGVMGFDED